MSYTSFCVYMQRRATGGSGPGGDCDPYTYPSPASVLTDLTTTPPILQTATVVETNLCAPVS